MRQSNFLGSPQWERIGHGRLSFKMDLFLVVTQRPLEPQGVRLPSVMRSRTRLRKSSEKTYQ